MKAGHDKPYDQDPTAEPHDPKLESLLDEALAPGEAPPYLSDMIVDKTLPQFRRRTVKPPVLARIGRPLLRAAAVIAIGAAVVFALVNAPPDAWQDDPIARAPADPEPPTLAELGDQLAELAELSQAQASEVDVELDLLAMHVELLSAEHDWNETSQQDVMEQAVTRHQLELMTSEPLQMF